MKNFIAILLLSFLSDSLYANDYGGIGIGLVEACKTKYQPSFSGGDCISPDLDIHGFVGREASDYFTLEASIDAAISSGTAFDFIVDASSDTVDFNDAEVTSDRWGMVNFGVHALVTLPLSYSVRLFGGPSFGMSITSFDYDVKYFGDENSSSQSSTNIGLNYGWKAGIDFGNLSGSFMRLQWQNWRGLDASASGDKSGNKEFNSNALTVSWVGRF
ncbi:hypothetical protein [Cellvibrio sp.]|uniref:hypothetical protein n=1 Tax=Cellvibrio sp. TaxID=1965322 RepID=UPI0039648B2D